MSNYEGLHRQLTEQIERADHAEEEIKRLRARVGHLERAESLKILQLRDRIEELKSALSEIAEGRGPFSRDPLEHADNCIEDMKRIATEAIDGTWKVVGDE
jgi:predicted  nucleic acid-binding Zn-ribbon protein